MGYIPSLQEAETLLKEYNKEPFHIVHGLTVAGVMGVFAKQHDPEHVEYWKVVGMLHDIDFELYPEEHCIKSQEILREKGIDEGIIRSTASHCYGMRVDIEPVHIMEKYLYATDELTGLIGAAVRMRPSKSAKDLELSSLKKKFKDKKFAAGCSRDVIAAGAEMLGIPLDDLLEQTILAMRELEG